MDYDTKTIVTAWTRRGVIVDARQQVEKFEPFGELPERQQARMIDEWLTDTFHSEESFWRWDSDAEHIWWSTIGDDHWNGRRNERIGWGTGNTQGDPIAIGPFKPHTGLTLDSDYWSPAQTEAVEALEAATGQPLGGKGSDLGWSGAGSGRGLNGLEHFIVYLTPSMLPGFVSDAVAADLGLHVDADELDEVLDETYDFPPSHFDPDTELPDLRGPTLAKLGELAARVADIFTVTLQDSWRAVVEYPFTADARGEAEEWLWNVGPYQPDTTERN